MIIQNKTTRRSLQVAKKVSFEPWSEVLDKMNIFKDDVEMIGLYMYTHKNKVCPRLTSILTELKAKRKRVIFNKSIENRA